MLHQANALSTGLPSDKVAYNREIITSKKQLGASKKAQEPQVARNTLLYSLNGYL